MEGQRRLEAGNYSEAERHLTVAIAQAEQRHYPVAKRNALRLQLAEAQAGLLRDRALAIRGWESYLSSGLFALAGSAVRFWRTTSVWSEKNVRPPELPKASGFAFTEYPVGEPVTVKR